MNTITISELNTKVNNLQEQINNLRDELNLSTKPPSTEHKSLSTKTPSTETPSTEHKSLSKRKTTEETKHDTEIFYTMVKSSQYKSCSELCGYRIINIKFYKNKHGKWEPRSPNKQKWTWQKKSAKDDCIKCTKQQNHISRRNSNMFSFYTYDKGITLILYLTNIYETLLHSYYF